MKVRPRNCYCMKQFLPLLLKCSTVNVVSDVAGEKTLKIKYRLKKKFSLFYFEKVFSLCSCRELARPGLASLVISEHVNRSWKNLSIFEEFLVSNCVHFSQSLRFIIKLESTKINGEKEAEGGVQTVRWLYQAKKRSFLCKELQLERILLPPLP